MRPVSFSGMQLYRTCPAAFRHRYLIETPAGEREASPAAARGTAIHKSIEDYLNRETLVMDGAVFAWAPSITKLRDQNARPEVRFAFTEDWETCDFDDMENAFIRGVLDCIHVVGDRVIVHEWKTGKRYSEHDLQRSLYALAALMLYPDAVEAEVLTCYLDAKKGSSDRIARSAFSRGQLVSLQWLWERSANETKPPQLYPETPSWKCRFCDYSKRHGGPCQN